jgi:riboflavin biosynthesis pyrimidine reductase
LRRLFPDPAGEIDDAELESLYAYPAELAHPWVQVNFVSSADGASTVDDRSRGLSSPGDSRIFGLGRDLAEVILAGAGTVQSEGYRGVKPNEVSTERRARLGLAEVPTIAVVTRRCMFDPESPIIADTVVPTIILTCLSAPEERRDALAKAGAEVIVAGETTVDLAKALRALADRGLYRVNCEGGPRLFGELITADLIDQLCLTISPLLVSGEAARVAHGLFMPAEPLRLSLASVLSEVDGSLMLRYRRSR